MFPKTIISEVPILKWFNGVKNTNMNNMHDIWDDYWIVFKNGEYVSGTDEFGYPFHTKDKSKAYKFYDFNVAISYFNLGYAVIKN